MNYMPDEELDYKKLYEDEQRKVGFLSKQLSPYEENGTAKLYYAMNRKAWEMADMLNAVNLKTIDISDPKDKSFERIRYIINDSSGIATAVQALGAAAGVTGDEGADIKPKRRMTSPESVAQDIGDYKTHDV